MIKYSIILKDKAYAPQSGALLAFLDESALSFLVKLDVDSNAVARKCQMHFSTHNATCYKCGAVAIG